MVSQWLSHNGRRIFYADYRGMDAPKVRVEIKDVVKEIMTQPLNSVLFLVDANQIVIGPEMLTIFIGGASQVPKYCKRTAVLGISGLRQKIMDVIVGASGMKNIKSFMDKQEAMNWLAT